MSEVFIVPIVEGHGELEAIPILLRRIFHELRPGIYPDVNAPWRVKSGSFIQTPAYFERYIKAAAEQASHKNGTVLILLDCEDDCPAELGPVLLERARSVRGDVSYLVVLANREYETWFLAAAESLRGKCGLSDDLMPPPNPEAIRGAKEWLTRHMRSSYDPVIHQAKLTASFSFEIASQVHSFKRFVSKIVAL